MTHEAQRAAWPRMSYARRFCFLASAATVAALSGWQSGPHASSAREQQFSVKKPTTVCMRSR